MTKENLISFLIIITPIIASFIIVTYFIKISTRTEADLSAIEKANSSLSKYKVYFWGWIVEYSSKSKETYYKYHDKFTWVSPTWYVVDENGNVIEKVYDKEFVNKSRAWGVKVIPLIANKGFSSVVAHKILSDKSIKEKVINSIVNIVLKRDYDGINIDFEGVPADDRKLFNDFIKELATKLHKYGKLLTIDVPAKTYDARTGWAGAFDYKELGKYCDLIIIMIYDYHYPGSQPGPISPLDWYERVLDFAITQIPKNKIVAGIPFYGYDWPASGRAKGVTYEMAIDLAKKYYAKVYFDYKVGEATFTYTAFLTRHEVWFNIAKSTELRIKIALSKGINKIAAWRVGQEDPATWKIIERP